MAEFLYVKATEINSEQVESLVLSFYTNREDNLPSSVPKLYAQMCMQMYYEISAHVEKKFKKISDQYMTNPVSRTQSQTTLVNHEIPNSKLHSTVACAGLSKSYRFCFHWKRSFRTPCSIKQKNIERQKLIKGKWVKQQQRNKNSSSASMFHDTSRTQNI